MKSDLNKSPHMAFFGEKSSDLVGTYIFGQIGFCPSLKTKPNIYAKGKLVRYLHREYPNKLVAELENGSRKNQRKVF